MSSSSFFFKSGQNLIPCTLMEKGIIIMSIAKGVLALKKGQAWDERRAQETRFQRASARCFSLFSRQATTSSLPDPANDLHTQLSKQSCCVDVRVGLRMEGWVDGLWYFTPFDFSYFQVWKRATCVASKYGLKSSIRLLDKKLWAF